MISTERLILREYEEDDYLLFKSVYTDPEIMKYAYVDVYQSEEAIRNYFDKIIQDS